MAQDNETAVYHRDKGLDAILWVCESEFVTESTAMVIDSVVELGLRVDLYAYRSGRTLGRLAFCQGQRAVPRSVLAVGCMRVDAITGRPRSPHGVPVR